MTNWLDIELNHFDQSKLIDNLTDLMTIKYDTFVGKCLSTFLHKQIKKNKTNLDFLTHGLLLKQTKVSFIKNYNVLDTISLDTWVKILGEHMTLIIYHNILSSLWKKGLSVINIAISFILTITNLWLTYNNNQF